MLLGGRAGPGRVVDVCAMVRGDAVVVDALIAWCVVMLCWMGLVVRMVRC